MAVAHSAASESHAATTGSVSQTAFSWTHTQTGTPQGVLVFVHVANSTGNPVSSVTYGSVTLTRVSGGAAVDSAGEEGRTDLFFAGSGLASGNQTITVNRANTTDIMYASAATVTALTNTNVTGIVLLEGDGTLAVQSVTDGGAPTNSLRYAAAYSGLASPPPAGTGSTLLNSIDFGNYGIALVVETTAGTGARNVGFNNATTDDRAAVHVAVRELWNRTDTETVGAFTLTGQPNTLAKGRVMTGDRGTFTLTGQPADLRHNPKIDGGVGAFTHTGRPADLRIGHAIAGDVGKFFLPERNKRQWSEEFNNAYWTKSQASITPNATIAPDGTLTADALIENSTPSIGHQITRNITYVTGKTYTHSCYFKLYPGPITRYVRLQLGGTTVFGSDVYANINLATGVVTNTPGLGATTSVTNVGNGWYRASISLQYTGAGVTTGPSITLISTAGSSLYTDADGLSGVYLWGVQWEESASVTDYDPTGAAGATDATLRQAYRLDGGVGAFTFTGRAADTLHNVRIEGGTGAFAFTGNDATLTEAAASKVLTADTGTFAFTGQPATLAKGRTITAETGAFIAAGQPATLRHNPRIEANTGSFALSGGSPALLRGRYLSGGAGEFIETGQPATFRRTWAVQAATGAFSFTGNPASLTELGAYEIAATVGGFALSGQPANLAQSQTMPVNAGTFNFTGQQATLRQSQALAAETGAFAISGQPAGLTQGYQLNILAGVFALSSNGVAFRRTWAVAPEGGAFAITGLPAVLTEQGAFGIEAGSGSFALSGNNASLAQSRTLSVTAGGFSLTGNAATLSALRAVQLTATATVFTVSGNAVTLRTSHLLSATFGSFALTGNNANLSDTDELLPATGIYVLTSYAAALSKTTAIRRRNVLIF